MSDLINDIFTVDGVTFEFRKEIKDNMSNIFMEKVQESSNEAFNDGILEGTLDVISCLRDRGKNEIADIVEKELLEAGILVNEDSDSDMDTVNEGMDWVFTVSKMIG